MHGPIACAVGTALVLTTLSFPSAARAQGEIEVHLVAQRVVVDAKGSESFQPADQAKPGDLIEYRVAYRNPGTRGIANVLATLPLPAGLEYVPRSASPQRVRASLDGQTFAPVPLKRRVRLADGREVLRDVPAHEYRWLRWSIGTVAAGKEQTVRARARVSAAPTAAVIR